MIVTIVSFKSVTIATRGPVRTDTAHAAPMSHFAPNVLGARTPVAQRNAELTLAIWKGTWRMAYIPATTGMTARIGPRSDRGKRQNAICRRTAGPSGSSPGSG